MKRVFEFFIIALLALWLSRDAWAADPIRIVVFGDSLTSGYDISPEEAFPAQLGQKLKTVGFSNVEVTNMSQAGATTQDGLDRIGSVLTLQPDIVIVELGTNDALRGIKTDIIYKNLGNLVAKLAGNKIYTIMIGTKAPARMGYSYNYQFQAIFRQIASVYNAALYPFALEGIVGNQDLNLADGFHPNAKGVEVMMEQVYPLVDAAVRWEWEVHQQREDWIKQNQATGTGMAPEAQ